MSLSDSIVCAWSPDSDSIKQFHRSGVRLETRGFSLAGIEDWGTLDDLITSASTSTSWQTEGKVASLYHICTAELHNCLSRTLAPLASVR